MNKLVTLFSYCFNIDGLRYEHQHQYHEQQRRQHEQQDTQHEQQRQQHVSSDRSKL